MAKWNIDTSNWPHVKITVPDEYGDEDVKEYLNKLDEIRLRGKPYTVVVDSRAAMTMTSLQRKMQTDNMKKCGPSFLGSTLHLYLFR